MTGIQTLFPRSSFVGFDHLLNELESAVRQANNNYPPHNIIKTSDTEYLIELAVAGFTIDDLSIEVKDRTLTISGTRVPADKNYVHQGISAKKFIRTFRLSEHVHVDGADLKNGILSVVLKYIVPEEMRPRKVTIKTYEE